MNPDPHGAEPSPGLEGFPQPEPKGAPELGPIRATRDAPARFNGRIIGAATVGTAVVIMGVIVYAGFHARPHPKTSTAQSSPTPPPTPAPVDALAYDSPPANPTAGTPGVDCSLYPGMPNCVQVPTQLAGALPPAAATTATASQAGPVVALAAAPASTPEPPKGGGLDLAQAIRPSAAGARASGVFFGGVGAPVGRLAEAAESVAGRVASSPGQSLPPTPIAFPNTPATAAKAPDDVSPQNGQGEKAAFERTVAAQDYIDAHIQKPRSPYEVKAGSVIAAALLTPINSDLPGEIIAQVTQPVYDHVTGRYVLIPQGARIIGRYDSQVAYGQNRAMVVWHRVIFPNGNSINFGTMNGTDASGTAGVADRVNDHWGQLAKGIVLSTLLSVGTSSAQQAQARTSGGLVLNSGASGLANEADNVGSRITARDLNRQPTIEIRQGMQVRVLVDKDMVLEPYV
ncbi:MAG: TrbI/VirB10 family protein [Caulobacteraceae bacterium]